VLAADLPIIVRRFEWWFKQCDESNLNCAPRFRRFRQRFVSQLGNGSHLDYCRRLATRTEGTMTTYRRAAMLLFSTIGLAIAVNFVLPARAADPLGKWYTADNDSQVRITNCGGALCGTLVWLKTPIDPATGQPKLDKNNADAAKQSRPLLGVPIVLAMTPSGAGVWSGDVYNASDGKTYSGSFTMTGDDTADLKGCVMSIICKTQTWTRAK
jgi:uncharacterized protein (DUF2147 family)